jgi:hypothetical protein
LAKEKKKIEEKLVQENNFKDIMTLFNRDIGKIIK